MQRHGYYLIQLTKQVFGEYDPITLIEMIKQTLTAGLYDPAILDRLHSRRT